MSYAIIRPQCQGFDLTKHPLYGSWKSLRQRCKSKTCKDYPRYGGRGIKVCKRWDNPNGDSAWEGFINFVNDMGYKPTKDSQIDRINNDGDYCPENCRWASPLENSRNRRHPHTLGKVNLGPHPYIYKYLPKKYDDRWYVKIPLENRESFFCKYNLTMEQAKALVDERRVV